MCVLYITYIYIYVCVYIYIYIFYSQGLDHLLGRKLLGALQHRLGGNTNRVVSNQVVSKGPLYPSKTKINHKYISKYINYIYIYICIYIHIYTYTKASARPGIFLVF